MKKVPKALCWRLFVTYLVIEAVKFILNKLGFVDPALVAVINVLADVAFWTHVTAEFLHHRYGSED